MLSRFTIFYRTFLLIYAILFDRTGKGKTYIQSAYLGTEDKEITENKSFLLAGDSFPKIIVRHDIRKRWYDDNGILNVGIIDFLLDDTLV